MHKISALAFGAALLMSTAAMAQDSVVVDLSGIRADLAAELNVDIDDLPSTISLSAEAAAEACGIAVGDLSATCAAIDVSADLLTVLQASIGNGSNSNSARDFAPGQQDGPAKDSAPGQQEGDAKDSAPGQMKKT